METMCKRLRQLWADIKAYSQMQEQEREMVTWLSIQDTATWMLIARLSQLKEQELKDIWTLISNASCYASETPQAREERQGVSVADVQAFPASSAGQKGEGGAGVGVRVRPSAGVCL